MHATAARKASLLVLVAIASIVALGAGSAARADATGPITFEGYNLGTVDGQDGWSSGGAAGNGCAVYDHQVAAQSLYGEFGTKSLRLSNAATSGCFGDQTFSKPINDAGGESGPRHFEAQWQFGSTVQGAEQPGLSVVASPDPGDGSRMSWVQMADNANGLSVNFTDVQGTGNPANFVTTTIASGLARNVAHTIKITMDFFAGPSNDVVKVYVDGVLKHTGTSWENYYRFDSEQAGNGNLVPAVKRILFRTGGTAAPNTLGNGFLVDNLSLASSNGPCVFATDGTTMTMTLLADCTTDHTILVTDGFTLDGAGHKITAVDPAGGHFVGAVVMNGGALANVRNVEITSAGLADICDADSARLRGILFDNAAGEITNVNVHGVRQGLSGCQEGNAIEARNFASNPVTRLVTVSNSAVSDYQKNGITVNGAVSGTITGNTVTGDGPVSYIAQNGIQVGFGGSALLRGNTVSGNYYTPESDVACGILFFEASGVKQQANTLFANEVNLCNFGRGGGKP
jgi:parallel beta helix pectate lyase-like protein